MCSISTTPIRTRSSTRRRPSRPRCSRSPKRTRSRGRTCCLPSCSASKPKSASATPYRPATTSRGWHITSTCGVFGAAIAIGKALALDAQRLVWAIGNASVQTSRAGRDARHDGEEHQCRQRREQRLAGRAARPRRVFRARPAARGRARIPARRHRRAEARRRLRPPRASTGSCSRTPTSRTRAAWC